MVIPEVKDLGQFFIDTVEAIVQKVAPWMFSKLRKIKSLFVSISLGDIFPFMWQKLMRNTQSPISEKKVDFLDFGFCDFGYFDFRILIGLPDYNA